MDCASVPLVGASFFAAFIAEFAFASLGFGPAILYEITWQLLSVVGIANGDLEAAISNLIIIEVPAGIIQTWNLRKHFQTRLALLFNLPLALTLPIGTVLLEHFGKSPWMKRMLGVLFLVVVTIQVINRRRQARDGQVSSQHGSGRALDVEPRTLGATTAVIGALSASGLLRGLFGVAGPPVMVLLMHYTLEREVWRCIAAQNRMTIVAVQGMMLGLHSDIQAKCWPTYASLVVGGLAGLAVGNLVAKYIDAQAFQRWLLLFLGAGALLMLVSGLGQGVQVMASLLVAVAALTVACGPIIGRRRRRVVVENSYPLASQGSPATGPSNDGRAAASVNANGKQDVRQDV